MTQFDERREPLQEEDGGRLEDSFSISSEENNRNRTLRRRDALECLVRERKEGERRARQAGLHEHAQVIDSSSDDQVGDTQSSNSSLGQGSDTWKNEKKKKLFCAALSQRDRSNEGQGLVQYQGRYYTNDRDDSISSGMEDFIATSSSSSLSESRDDDDCDDDDGKEHKSDSVSPERSSRKRKSLLIHSSSSSSSDDADTKNERNSESEDDIVLTPCEGGGRKKVLGHGRRRTPVRRAKVKERVSPIDRIRNAQDNVLHNDDTPSVSRDEVSSPSSVSPRPSGEVICLLTDQGDPGTTDDAYSSPSPSPSRHDYTTQPHAWEVEVRKMGVHKLTEQEYLEAYIEYLFICSMDPSYEQTVKESESHASLYSTAIRKIEYMILHAQDAVHSEIWRKCDLFLLEALEQHEIVHLDLDEDGLQDPDIAACEGCSACGRFNANKRIQFDGWFQNNKAMAGDKDAGMTLSHQYELASPIYQRNRQWIMKESYYKTLRPRTTFPVGSICGHRLFVFHGLYHFRHHCIKYLTLLARQHVKRHAHSSTPLDKNSLIDSVLNTHAHSKIHECFTELINIAESYNIQGGKEEDEETRRRKRLIQMRVPSQSLQDELIAHPGPLSPIRMNDDTNDDDGMSASE